MPIPAIIGLVLIVGLIALIVVRRAWSYRKGEPAPGESYPGRIESGGGGGVGGAD